MAKGVTKKGGNSNDTMWGTALGDDTLSGGNGKDIIYGGGGNDTLYGDGPSALDVNEENAKDILYGGSGQDKLFGGNGADQLFGDEYDISGPSTSPVANKINWSESSSLTSFNDNLDGGNGGDLLVGGLGGDSLTGGLGPDVFRYDRMEDSKLATQGGTWSGTSGFGGNGTGDTITDFQQGPDKLDFTQINAETHEGKQGQLHFIGAKPAGEADLKFGIWYEQDIKDTFVYADTDGDGNADMAIKLNGLVDLKYSDFIGVNDAPIITSDGGGNTAALALDENETSVTTVTATDADYGAVLKYSISGGADAALFTINEDSGVLSFIDAPDRENPTDSNLDSVYNVTVRVSDGITFDEQAIQVTVNNVDEVGPTFDSGTEATAINENSGDHQVVYTAAAHDTDFNSPDTADSVTYSLGSVGGDESLFSIDGTTGEVTLIGDPNHEDQASYSFEVVATDAAGNETKQTVTLAINDLDESAPVFTSLTTATAIDENSGTGQVVYTVAATDTADVDDSTDTSGALVYSLGSVGGDESLFSIDGTTGEVTLIGDPNHEDRASYSFEVVATDAAGNETKQTVTLAINDLDESAPVFTSLTTATAIDENSGAGQVVYTATSTDTVDYVAGSTSYSLKSVGDWSAFTINASSGAVTLTGNPDYETKSSYSFTVVATDAAGNFSEKAVTLAINNISEGPASAPAVFTDTGDPNDSYTGTVPPGYVLWTGTGENDIYGGNNGKDLLVANGGDDTINGGNSPDLIYGGIGDDKLYGDGSGDVIYGGSGFDTIQGNDSDDTIIGGYGADTLTGGVGADIFKYLSVKDTGDTITDFVSGTDKIDLRDLLDIDGNETSLSFIGTSTTTLSENSVIWFQQGGNTIVQVDTDGAIATAELQITLTGLKNLTSSDFTLV